MNAFANAEEQTAAGGKAIGDAPAQRELGTDDSEVDLLAVGQREERVRIGEVCGGDSGDQRDARIAGRADDFGDVALSGQTRDERVFARAAPEHEDPQRHRTCRDWNSLIRRRLAPARDMHTSVLRTGLFR
jgi:hypothetical protein